MFEVVYYESRISENHVSPQNRIPSVFVPQRYDIFWVPTIDFPPLVPSFPTARASGVFPMPIAIHFTLYVFTLPPACHRLVPRET